MAVQWPEIEGCDCNGEFTGVIEEQCECVAEERASVLSKLSLKKNIVKQTQQLGHKDGLT